VFAPRSVLRNAHDAPPVPLGVGVSEKERAVVRDGEAFTCILHNAALRVRSGRSSRGTLPEPSVPGRPHTFPGAGRRLNPRDLDLLRRDRENVSAAGLSRANVLWMDERRPVADALCATAILPSE
jgi:hypothetical protein